MKQFFNLILVAMLLLTACQTGAAEPTDTPTSTPTPPPTATETITLTPTPEIVRVGGSMEGNGHVRYQSKKAGISFSLPVEWLCVNLDDDLYETSLAAAQASMPDNPGRFGRYLESLTWLGNNRQYCFIPDTPGFKNWSDLGLYVLETQQQGFNSILARQCYIFV